MSTRERRIAIGAAALSVVLAVMFFAIGFAAEPAKLPPAEKVLDAYVEATGGLAAYDKIQNAVSKGTMGIPAAGIALDLTVYAARPNKTRFVASSPAIGSIERGTDGTIFWERTTMQGARLLEGEELAEALREAVWENMVYWRSSFDTVSVAGIDTVDGNPCYKVVMKPKEGKPRTVFFDKSSGLIAKIVVIATTQGGDVPTETLVSDYRKVGDFLVAYKSVQKVMGMEQVMTMTNIEQNAAIPDSIFAIPADIQALMEKK